MKKKIFGILFVCVLIVALTVVPVAVSAEPHSIPGGPWVAPTQEVSYARILTFADIERELFRLEKLSRGQITLLTVGYSVLGRPLYAAVIGTGDTRVWIQGRIHGGEKYGAEACLIFLGSLLNKNKKLLDKMTFMIIPCYNPDGSELNIRGNINRTDLNRDWWPFFREPESRAFWYAWADFKPHYALDLHHQGTFYLGDTNYMTSFSLGIPLTHGPPQQIMEDSRRIGVVAYDAVEKLGYCYPSRYPVIHIPNAVTASMMLGNPGPLGEDPGWNTISIFFENRSVYPKASGYLIWQNVVAIEAIVNVIASGELAAVDEARWWDIPLRPRPIPNPLSYEQWFEYYEWDAYVDCPEQEALKMIKVG